MNNYLKTGVTGEFEQNFHDSDVALIDGNVQRGLAPLVASVQIGSRVSQQLHHRRLVPKGCMMNGPISVLVLQTTTTTTTINANRLITSTYCQHKPAH